MVAGLLRTLRRHSSSLARVEPRKTVPLRFLNCFGRLLPHSVGLFGPCTLWKGLI